MKYNKTACHWALGFRSPGPPDDACRLIWVTFSHFLAETDDMRRVQIKRKLVEVKWSSLNISSILRLNQNLAIPFIFISPLCKDHTVLSTGSGSFPSNMMCSSVCWRRACFATFRLSQSLDLGKSKKIWTINENHMKICDFFGLKLSPSDTIHKFEVRGLEAGPKQDSRWRRYEDVRKTKVIWRYLQVTKLELVLTIDDPTWQCFTMALWQTNTNSILYTTVS